MLRKFLLEKKAQGEWNLLYMILILAIVAIVLIYKIKPLFKQSIEAGTKTEGVETPKLNET